MLIGITGGIGSGKSTLAEAFVRLGYAVYNTDTEAKRIIVENLMVRSQIEVLFGSEVYDGDTYLTEQVAKRVFKHPELLEQLNRIVHPAVSFDLKQWARHQEGICFVESAILFESGLNTLCDRVIAVVAPEAIRLERTLQRDHRGSHSKAHEAAVQARMEAQMSDAERAKRADIVLHNDGAETIDALAQEALAQIARK